MGHRLVVAVNVYLTVWLMTGIIVERNLIRDAAFNNTSLLLIISQCMCNLFDTSLSLLANSFR